MTGLIVAAAAAAIAGLGWLLRGYRGALRACLILDLGGILGGLATGRTAMVIAGVVCAAWAVYELAVTR